MARKRWSFPAKTYYWKRRRYVAAPAKVRRISYQTPAVNASKHTQSERNQSTGKSCRLGALQTDSYQRAKILLSLRKILSESRTRAVLINADFSLIDPFILMCPT
jgi:hypothetical protein